MDFATFDAMAPEEKRFERVINMTALAASVPPCALAAICRRESNWDAGAHSKDGGFGICQITSGATEDGRYCAKTDEGDQLWYNLFNADDNLIVSAKYFLRPAIDACLKLRGTHGVVMDSFEREILYFAFAAYNAGFGAVESAVLKGEDPDFHTTNRYASGTLAIYHRYLAMAHGGTS